MWGGIGKAVGDLLQESFRWWKEAQNVRKMHLAEKALLSIERMTGGEVMPNG